LIDEDVNAAFEFAAENIFDGSDFGGFVVIPFLPSDVEVGKTRLAHQYGFSLGSNEKEQCGDGIRKNNGAPAKSGVNIVGSLNGRRVELKVVDKAHDEEPPSEEAENFNEREGNAKGAESQCCVIKFLEGSMERLPSSGTGQVRAQKS
jgi:hypothetical protein